MKTTTANTVFGLWMTLEALHLPESKVVRDDNDACVLDLATECVMPWSMAPGSLPEALQHVAGFVAQCVLLDTGVLCEALASTQHGAQQLAQPSNGLTTRVFDLEFDAQGLPIADSFALSLGAWATGFLQRTQGDTRGLLAGGTNLPGTLVPAQAVHPGIGLESYDTVTSAMRHWIGAQARMLAETKQTADSTWLGGLIDRVLHETGLQLPASQCLKACKFIGIAQSGRVKPEERAGSLQAQGLRNLVSASKQAGGLFRPLMQFIRSGDRADSCIDVRDLESTHDFTPTLHPSQFPEACWSSSHPLMSSQQSTVNVIWSSFKDGRELLAVDGSPRIANTAVLYDVAAAIVTERAKQLAALAGTVFGSRQSARVGNVCTPYYRLHAALQGFSIVVASSTHGAIKDFLRALCALQAVPQEVVNDGDCCVQVAGRATGKPAWALMAEALDTHGSHAKFMHAFGGLREQLKQGQGQAQVLWHEAVQGFNAAMAAERKMRTQHVTAADRAATLADLVARRAKLQSALSFAEQNLLDKSTYQLRLAARFKPLQQSLHLLSAAHIDSNELIRQHMARRPGWFARIRSLGISDREWHRTAQQIDARMQEQITLGDTLLSRFEPELAKMKGIDQDIATLQRERDRIEQHLVQVQAQLDTEQSKLMHGHESLGEAWLQTEMPSPQHEYQQPWADQDWIRARHAVFLAALRLHDAFIQTNAEPIIANIDLASDWYAGKPMPQDLAQLALDSLCLVVPVVSTTFAATPGMFTQLGRESIGWLLVDEANTALPSFAAGALWKARRALVVGEPV
ncbi:MAG: hypothetical protein BGO13_03875 [Burkholderiales bacterium 66-5]|nr:MAG: hypothetical protein BGO13_03875 [Burkholderiales bacterium 66-5]